MVFEARKTVTFKSIKNGADVFPREAQATSDTLLMPALIEKAHHSLTSLIGIFKVVEQCPCQWQLDGNGIAVQEMLDGMMIGVVAELTL